MIKTIPLAALFLTASIFAQQHRHEGAHEHGSASLGVVVEGRTIHFEFEAPADNIIGFEHEPKTAADRASQKAGLDKLRNNLPAILKLDSSTQWADIARRELQRLYAQTVVKREKK